MGSVANGRLIVCIQRRDPSTEWGFTLSMTEDGVSVTQISQGSPSDESSLKLGDVVFSVNGKRLSRHSRPWFVYLAVEHSRECNLGVDRSLPTDRPKAVDGDGQRRKLTVSDDKVQQIQTFKPLPRIRSQSTTSESNKSSVEAIKRLRISSFDFSPVFGRPSMENATAEPLATLEDSDTARHSDRQLLRMTGTDRLLMPDPNVPNEVIIRREEEAIRAAKQTYEHRSRARQQRLVMTSAERRGQRDLPEYDFDAENRHESILERDASARMMLNWVSTSHYGSAYM